MAGTLPVGRYEAVAQSVGCYGGFTWVTLRYQSAVYWTALLADRCFLLVPERVARRMNLFPSPAKWIKPFTVDKSSGARPLLSLLPQRLRQGELPN